MHGLVQGEKLNDSFGTHLSASYYIELQGPDDDPDTLQETIPFVTLHVEYKIDV